MCQGDVTYIYDESILEVSILTDDVSNLRCPRSSDHERIATQDLVISFPICDYPEKSTRSHSSWCLVYMGSTIFSN